MLWFGHAATGYLLTTLILSIMQPELAPEQLRLLILFGTVAAVIPDLDFVFFFTKHRSLKLREKESHRAQITHTPLFWLVLSALVFLAGFTAGGIFGIYLGVLVLAGTWSHLLSDSIEYGVMWLWPFSRRQFYFRKVRGVGPSPRGISTAKYYWKFFTQVYVRNWTFYVEIALVIAALAVVL